MRIDLFDFVESVFRGFIYFIYNVFWTLWSLTVSPRRGPVRLHRAYQRASQRQIGGLTFLFLLIFMLFGAASVLSGGDAIGVLKSAPNLQSDAVWLPLLGAMIGTVLIDASLRIILRLRLPQRPGKRAILLSVLEYSLTWPVIFAFFAPLAILVPIEGLDAFIFVIFIVPLFWLIAIATCAPAADFVLYCGRRHGRPRPARGIRRCLKRTLLQVLIFGLMFVAVSTGGYTAIWLSEEGEELAGYDTLPVTYLRCVRDGAQLRVTAALHNPTDEAVVAELGRDVVLELTLPTSTADGAPQRVQPPLRPTNSQASGMLLLSPGGSQLVDLTAPLEPEVEYLDCRLAGYAGSLVIETDVARYIERADGG